MGRLLWRIRLLVQPHWQVSIYCCLHPWQEKILQIEKILDDGLAACRQICQDVADVRVLGAIGVVELDRAVDMQTIQHEFVAEGVWVRPFGKLIYLMPPYVIDEADLHTLTACSGKYSKKSVTVNGIHTSVSCVYYCQRTKMVIFIDLGQGLDVFYVF